MKHKAVAAVTVFALGVALSGCSTSAGPDSMTLTVLTSVSPGTEAGDALDAFVASFEEETGATVKLTQVGEEIPDVYETSVAGGKEADVVMVNLAEKTTTWVEQGIAMPASDYLDDWGLSDKINADALDAWTNADGVVQGFPYNGFVWPVWYNTDLLAQAGIDAPPTTIEELLEDAELLNAAGISPMVIGGIDWSGNKLFLQIVQSYMDSDEARAVYSEGGFCASANAMKGIELFAELRDAGVFVNDAEGYTADQMNAAFFEGKAAIMSAGSWAFGGAPDELRESVVLGGFPIPNGGAFDKPTAYEGYTGQGFWVSPNGAEDGKIDLVQKFITKWYTPEVSAAWAAATNGPTAVITDQPGGEIANSLTAQAVNDVPRAVEFAVMPDTVVPGGIQDSMIRETSAAYAKGTTPDAICGALDALYQQ